MADGTLRSWHITRAIRLTLFAQIGLRRLRIARKRYLPCLIKYIAANTPQTLLLGTLIFSLLC